MALSWRGKGPLETVRSIGIDIRSAKYTQPGNLKPGDLTVECRCGQKLTSISSRAWIFELPQTHVPSDWKQKALRYRID